MDARSVGRHLLVCGIVEGETLIFNCYNNEHQSSKLKWCDSKDSNAKTKFCCGIPIRATRHHAARRGATRRDAVRRGATRCDAVRRGATRCDAVRRGLCYGDENADIQS